MGAESDVRLQAHLGGVEPFRRKDQSMGGLITIGIIIEVHHKHHTADVQLLGSKDVITGTKSKDGKDACQIIEGCAGFDDRYQVYYGNITPYQKGQYVLIAFAENLKDRPFILGAVHYTDELKNPFPMYPVYESDEMHMFESLKISRLQDYWYMSGKSEFEGVHHSHAYIVARETPIDDSRDGFNFDNLYVKNKMSKTTIGLPSNKRESKPLDLLINLPATTENDSGFLRLWLSAKMGVLRVSKDASDNKLSFLEISELGDIRAKRQLDSNKVDQSSDYAEVKVGGNGNITISKHSEKGSTIISIDAEGNINISTPKTVSITGSESVSIKSSNLITLSSPHIEVNS